MEHQVEVLTIGDELLDGRVLDSNTTRLAEALATVGLTLRRRVSVRDRDEEIVAALNDVVAREVPICVVSGGLGPTTDDRTARVFADFLGVDLVRDEAHATWLRDRLAALNRPLTANQLQQADRPRGARSLPNAQGTALGFAVEVGSTQFVVVPGVPREFDAMVEAELIAPRRGVATRPRTVLRTFGLFEAQVDALLRDDAFHRPGLTVGFQAKFPDVWVVLTGDTEDVVNAATVEARRRLGAYVYTETTETLAEVVVAALRKAGASVTIAESCTGGLIADSLTDVAGASDVFHEGAVVYANSAKTRLLGVPSEYFDRFGAVSSEVVEAMATGARTRAGADYAVAVSGIAGPGGATPNKPVGTVWIAVAEANGVQTQKIQLPFDRRRNKVAFAAHALFALRNALRRAPTQPEVG